MEDFNKKESRKTPTTELIVQDNYLELVPRPSDEDYQRLKASIVLKGFDDANPIIVNENMVVLDGHTRLQIARELRIEWVYTIVKDLEDHYAEKRYIIETNLDRRHLYPAQRIEMGKKLLEINQAEAKERQRQAGELYGKSHPKQSHNSGEDSIESKDVPTLAQALEDDGSHQVVPTFVQAEGDQPEEQGRSIEITANQIELGKETFRKGLKILDAAKTDPEIAEAWDQAKQGKASVNQVYRKVQEKTGRKTGGGKKPRKKPECEVSTDEFIRKFMEPTYFERMTMKVPDLEPFPDDELLDALYQVADLKGIPREAIDGAIELNKQHRLEWCGKPESDIMAMFRWWSQGLFDAQLAWDLAMNWVERWQEQQRAALPQEVPIPENAKRLGPWALDFVHQAGLEDLVRDFPADSAHLIYSDAVLSDLEQIGLLGKLAARVLTAGKYLCVYADKRQLPEAMARLSAAGLTYFWSCSVFRNKQEVPDLHIRERWRLLLIYRKGEASEAGWDWFEDGVEDHHASNRVIIRQLLKGLTYQGQMVVDPFVGSGITSQVARSLGRRFLCFGAQEEDVRAANQRISQVRLAEEGT